MKYLISSLCRGHRAAGYWLFSVTKYQWKCSAGRRKCSHRMSLWFFLEKIIIKHDWAQWNNYLQWFCCLVFAIMTSAMSERPFQGFNADSRLASRHNYPKKTDEVWDYWFIEEKMERLQNHSIFCATIGHFLCKVYGQKRRQAHYGGSLVQT